MRNKDVTYSYLCASPGAIYRPNDLLFIIPAKANLYVQGWAKGWALGCVNPASWLPLAARGEFTQPRAHLFADPCT